MKYRGWFTKIKHVLRRYLFLFMIIISSTIFTGIGLLGKKTIYSDYKIEVWNTPFLAVVFEGAGEGRFPWKPVDTEKDDTAILLTQADNNRSNPDEDKSIEGNMIDNGMGSREVLNKGANANEGSARKTEDAKVPSAEKSDGHQKDENKVAKNKKAENKKAEHKSTNNEKRSSQNDALDEDSKQGNEKIEVVSPSPSIDDQVAVNNSEEVTEKSKDDLEVAAVGGRSIEAGNRRPHNLNFQKVNKDYFDDALFIGDSRTVGLSEYSNLDNSTFYADVGLSIYDIFERKIAKVDGKKETILKALGQKQFKKIYIMLGINELGTGTTKTFADEYQSVVDKIRKLQPEAIIFIEGIMNVGKEKSVKDPIFNNENIRKRNNGIAKLADNKNIFYLDVNEAVTDKSGNLPSKYTFDSIHLKAPYYKLWTEYLMKHGVVMDY